MHKTRLVSLKILFFFTKWWVCYQLNSPAVQGRPHIIMMFAHFKSLIQISNGENLKSSFLFQGWKILTFLGQIVNFKKLFQKLIGKLFLSTGWTWFDHFSNPWRAMSVGMKIAAQGMEMSESKSYLNIWFPFSLGTQNTENCCRNFVI